MRKIKNDIVNTIIINKSKFITSLYVVKTENEVKEILKEIKETYKDATHNCYAYVLDNGTKQKASDDGEPQGTAGRPILDVLLKNELTDILAVVTRYFGGIKLGAGGLTRAYSNSIQEALLQTEIIDKERMVVYEIKITYPTYARLSELLKICQIYKESFSNEISLTIGIKAKDEAFVINDIKNKGMGKVIITKIGDEN